MRPFCEGAAECAQLVTSCRTSFRMWSLMLIKRIPLVSDRAAPRFRQRGGQCGKRRPSATRRCCRGRTLHDHSRVRWLDQNRDPARDRAWRWGVAHNRDPARDRAWARGVAHNCDPARDRAWARGVAHNCDPARDRAWARGVSQNRDPARATRIAEISTLRLYCPLLNNNAPAPVGPRDNKKPTRCELAGFRTRLLPNPGSGASQPSL
jgi:hypothetical protein